MDTNLIKSWWWKLWKHQRNIERHVPKWLIYVFLPQMDVHSETRMGRCVLEGKCVCYINIHTNNALSIFNYCIDLLWKIHSEICKQITECGRAKQVQKFWNCFKNKKEKKRLGMWKAVVCFGLWAGYFCLFVPWDKSSSELKSSCSLLDCKCWGPRPSTLRWDGHIVSRLQRTVYPISPPQTERIRINFLKNLLVSSITKFPLPIKIIHFMVRQGQEIHSSLVSALHNKSHVWSRGYRSGKNTNDTKILKKLMNQQERGSGISSGGSLVWLVPTWPLFPLSPVSPPLLSSSKLQIVLRHFLCSQPLGKQGIKQQMVTEKNTDNKTKTQLPLHCLSSV